MNAEISRALATVETITTLTTIPDADAIEVAHVRGWDVVVRKGGFAVGDRVVYFEIDSALPLDDPRFDFLGVRGEKILEIDDVPTRVHVLKTARLRGVYSQGLVLLAADFAEIGDAAPGTDVTAVLSITKYEAPIPEGEYVGPFPAFARKSGAERVQNITSDAWAQVQADRDSWVPVEKIDGVSVTVWRDLDSELHIASRRWELVLNDDTPHVKALRESGIFDQLAPGEWIQGEVAGLGLPTNRLQLPAPRLFVFNYGPDIATGDPAGFDEWPDHVARNAAPRYDLELPETIAETVAQADGIKSLVTPKSYAEGIVWTHKGAVRARDLDDRHVFKAISQKYLMKTKG